MNNWTLPFIGFALAVFMGAALVSLLATLKPQWTARRRTLMAASILPIITAVATLIGIWFISTANHGQGQTMEDLAVAGMAAIGGGFTILALFGGLIGAALAGRRRGG
jgi:hypothetical protein